MVEPRAVLQDINLKFRMAAMAITRGARRPIPVADEFFAALAAIPISGPTEGLAVAAFTSILHDIEVLPADRAFDPAMLAGETLAACLLRSEDYGRIARDWARRDNPVGMMAVGRAYSKVADFDPFRIDIDVLLGLAARLGAKEPLPRDQQAALGYLGRVAGKLKANPDGIRLIEQLAHQSPQCRATAAHAIAFDSAMSPSLSYLSVFETLEPHPVQSAPPPRRLFWLFASLLFDSNPTVKNQAEVALELLRRSAPAMWNAVVNMRLTEDADMVPPEAPAPESTTPVADTRTAVARAVFDLAARTGRPWTLNDLRTLTQAHLARPAAGAGQPRTVVFALRFPQQSNAAQGVLTWDPALLKQEAELEASDAPLTRPTNAPRLFLSYRWSQSIDEIGLIDYFAGRLHMRGYDIVFDRDPRHLDKGLDADDVLLLMYGCTHFVPIVTTEALAILRNPEPAAKSPLELEWELARTLSRARPPLRWLGIWHSGDRLPRPLRKDAVADVRESWDALDRLFPTCTFRVESVFKSGKRRTSRALRRIDLPEAIAAATAKPGSVSINVYDVTERGPAWSGGR